MTRRGALAAVGVVVCGVPAGGSARERRERVTTAVSAGGDAVRERVPAGWREEVDAAVGACRRLAARRRDDPAVVDVGVGTRGERVGGLRRPVVVVHAAPERAPPAVPDAVGGVEVRVEEADPDAYVDAAGVRVDGAGEWRPLTAESVAGGERVSSPAKWGTATCRVTHDATPYLLHAAHVFEVCGGGSVGDRALCGDATVGRVAHASPRLDYVVIAEPAVDAAVSFDDRVVCAGSVDGHVTEAGVARLMAAETPVAAVGAASGWAEGRVTETHRNRAGCAGVGREFVDTSLSVERGDSGGPVFVAPDGGGRPSSASVVGLVSSLGGVCSSAYAIHGDGGFRFS